MEHAEEIDLESLDLFTDGLGKSIGYAGIYYNVLSIISSRPKLHSQPGPGLSSLAAVGHCHRQQQSGNIVVMARTSTEWRHSLGAVRWRQGARPPA